MPKYNFKCLDCKKEFELTLTLTEREEKDSPEKVCKACSSKNINQVISFGGVLKHGRSKSLDAGSGPCGSAGGGCPGGICGLR